MLDAVASNQKYAKWFEGKLCKYCGWAVDNIEDMSILFEVHGKCWQKYRTNNEVYGMPAHAG